MEIKHKNKPYLFLMYRNAVDDNKELKLALDRLPEILSTEMRRVRLCPSVCFTKTPMETDTLPDTDIPNVTFYQEIQPLDSSLHECTPKEYKSCTLQNAFQDTPLPFSRQWKPFREIQKTHLAENPNHFIALLLDIKTHSVAAMAEGNLLELETLEVHPGYRNQGLCTLFVWMILRMLRKWKMIQWKIHNAAGKRGEKCYRGGAQLADLKVKCQKYQYPKQDVAYCSDLLIELI
jgi:hypothetical protein